MSTLTARSLIRELRRLTVPKECVNCGSWDSWLCEDCRIWTGGAAPVLNLQIDCHPRGTLQVASAIPYEGLGKRVVLAHKERGLRPLVEVLASWLLCALRSADLGSDRVWLVPVPARAGSRRRRGFDPLLDLCRQAAAVLGSKVAAIRLLEWGSRARPQKRLSRGERLTNVAGRVRIGDHRSFELLRNSSSQVTVVLVDDVITTGATLAECHRALWTKGITCSRAATVCAVIK